MAKGYWIAQVDVQDSVAYQGYIKANARAFARFGARFLVRGGQAEHVEGTTRSRLVVLEFRTMPPRSPATARPSMQRPWPFGGRMRRATW